MWSIWKKLFGSYQSEDLLREEKNKTGMYGTDNQKSIDAKDRQDGDGILKHLQDPEIPLEQIPDEKTLEQWLGGKKLSDAQRELLKRTRFAADIRERKSKHSLESVKNGEAEDNEELIDGRLEMPEPPRTEEEQKLLNKELGELARRANEIERQIELRERLGRDRGRGGMGM